MWNDRFDDPLDDAETFRIDKGVIVEIGQRPAELDDVGGQYMGLLRLTPTGWQEIENLLHTLHPAERDSLDCTSLLQRLIGDNVVVSGYRTRGRWCEVDNQCDLELYTSRLTMVDREGGHWEHDWRWD